MKISRKMNRKDLIKIEYLKLNEKLTIFLYKISTIIFQF